MHHHTSTNVNFKLAAPFKSKTLNISCINLRLQELQTVVINIINRHCHKRSDAVVNGQPRTACSTQTKLWRIEGVYIFFWKIIEKERERGIRPGRKPDKQRWEGGGKLFFVWQQAAD